MKSVFRVGSGLRLLASGLAVAALALSAGTTLTAQSAGVATPDQAMQQKNAKLFASVKDYFPSDKPAFASRRLFRLTRDQIDATVQSLLPTYYKQSVKTVMARDPLQTNYEFAELLAVNQANLGALTDWIKAIADRARANPAPLFTCGTTKEAKACLRSEARAFVVRAFRGDVTEARADRFANFFVRALDAQGLGPAAGDLIEVVLASPSFLFRSELDVNQYSRLSPAQLLQSLTYTLADAPPERLGLDSTRAGQYLRTGAEAGPVIAAIVASQPAREKLVRFFKTWLEVKEPGDFTISKEVFKEFTPKLATAMLEETDRYLRTQLSKPSPRLADITRANYSFVPDALADIYGVKTEGLRSSAATALDPSQRLGIFTQPAVIASHSGPTDTRLVKRGVFWVRKVMCRDLEPPPPDQHQDLYGKLVTTERARIEASTSAAACAGCHKVINPFGFVLESYDALGRWRTKDNGHPVDASISVDFLDEGPLKAAGPVEALKAFTGSMMFKQCFVRQMFRFYMGRNEEASDDPLLRRMLFEFVDGDQGDILRMVQLLGASDRIVRRQ